MADFDGKSSLRVYMDGCFDMVHYGHANAIRQARQLVGEGGTLVVGIHNDEDINKHKGPPVYNEKERLQLVKAIKWADEVMENAPWPMTLEKLDELNCDAIAHGDDKSISKETGLNAYQRAIDAGRYLEFKRTQGVSTTDVVGRMLLMTTSHHDRSNNVGELDTFSKDQTGICKFAASTRKIMQFSSGSEPRPGDKIVYTSGSFDLLHSGHVSFLEKIAQMGDYVIIGCHTDECVNWYKGSNYPILNIHERTLGLLSCRYVSEVLIGAPYTLTKEIIDHFKIDLVVHGDTCIPTDKDGNDPFAIAKDLGIFKIVNSDSTRTTTSVVETIIKNRLEYEKRNQGKRILDEDPDIINEGKILKLN